MPGDHRSIGELAYQLWQARGCPQGSAEQDWLEAEKQLEPDASSPKQADITSKAIDDSLKSSFPASDPPATQRRDDPPANADQKWKAAGITQKTSTRRGPPATPPK